MSVVPRPTVDSFFVFDSLIEDTYDDEKRNQLSMFKVELNTSKSMNKVTDRIPPSADANEQKEALIQIRELAYQAEYLINSHVVGNIPTWYIDLRLPSIGKEIKTVNEKLRQVKNVHVGDVRKTYDREVASITRGNPSAMDASEFLNFNEDTENKILADLLRNSVPSRKMIVITGMPGLGKTTTATKLYNCQEISGHFDQLAWCVVSQTYSLRELFIQILRDIAARTDQEKEAAELGVSIHKTLKGRRYLMVLDDVWESNVLDQMVRYLPDDRNGSRVIVTTRVKGVAPDDSISHALSLLSNDQCWELFKKKVFPNPEDSSPLQFEDIGMQITGKCCGIPLAVVNAAGILVHLEKERSLWKRVADQLDVLLLDDRSNYRKILELSYEHLPRNLKPCFLYFVLFPEDAEISKKTLILMWISGSLIPKEGNNSLAETAEMYFLDLINRSLVLPARRGSDGRISTCKIHDLLHDLCVAKADEENFIKSTKVFSIYGKHQVCASDMVLKHSDLHSRYVRLSHKYDSHYFRTRPLLKTVELPSLDYMESGVCPRFDLPFQLKYLCIGELQERTVASLVNLEVIHVRRKNITTPWLVFIPSVIFRIVKLRHLLIKDDAEFCEDSINIPEETNLRSLSKVRIKRMKDEDILRHSPRLQTLKIVCGGEILFPDLSALAELESSR